MPREESKESKEIKGQVEPNRDKKKRLVAASKDTYKIAVATILLPKWDTTRLIIMQTSLWTVNLH